MAVVLQYTIQYNTINKNTKNTYTLKTIHSTKITNTITQSYKQNAQKEYDTRNIHIHYPLTSYNTIQRLHLINPFSLHPEVQHGLKPIPGLSGKHPLLFIINK